MLFRRRNKETAKDPAAQNPAQPFGAKEEGVRVKVLGSGCAKCKTLAASTEAALVALGLDPTIDHVTDFTQIAAYGVMSTPALVVDGKVVSYGKTLTTKQVIELLKQIKGLN